MSQHDFNIANQTFPSFRADLNDALQASATMSAGSSAPTTPYAYQLWFDTTTDTWKVRNSGNTAWISTITTDLATGNVGIGKSSPDQTLVVKTADGGGIAIENAAGNQYRWAVNGDDSFAVVDSGTAERLRIDSSGNVGIGTSSPSSKLEISGAGFQTLAVTSTNSSPVLKLNSAASSIAYLQWNNASSSPLSFYDLTASAERMRIDSSGVVKIHNVAYLGSPQTFAIGDDGGSIGGFLNQTASTPIRFLTSGSERMRLDSSGNFQVSSNGIVGGTNSGMVISATYGNFSVNVHGNDYPIINIHTSGANNRFLDFRWSNASVGNISTNGSTTSYNTSSDYRLKENVVADWDATTRLKQLNPVRFNFIADPDTTVDGFLAHEVQDIVPEAISGTHNGMRDEEYQVSAATGDIYTPAIEAVLDEDGNEVTPAVAEVIHSTDVERPEELAEGQLWRETTAAVMGTRSVPDYQGIDQSKLVPLLVKTIQELEARITALEAS